MTRRWLWIVLTVTAVVVAGGVSTWWWFAMPEQDRRVAEPSRLVDVPPPSLPGPWQHGELDPGKLSSDWGAQAQATATWQRPDSAEISYTVRRYASPRWAAWSFERTDRQGAEAFDQIEVRRAPSQLTGADESRYACGQIHGRPGECDNWWVELRYGQYLVQLQGTDVNMSNPDARTGRPIPDWLARLARSADGELRSHVPRR